MFTSGQIRRAAIAVLEDAHEHGESTPQLEDTARFVISNSHEVVVQALAELSDDELEGEVGWVQRAVARRILRFVKGAG